MSKIDLLTDFHPQGREEWRAWLERNHDTSPGVWLVYYKKSSGQPRVSYDEAVEEALCFGWIDSLPRKLDADRSKLLFTPRKPKSVWSALNKRRIKKLIREKLMTEAGLATIKTAKKNGSWNALDDVEKLIIPADLAEALKANGNAGANFALFSSSVRKGILAWIGSAKRPETRSRRIEKTVALAARNKRAVFDAE